MKIRLGLVGSLAVSFVTLACLLQAINYYLASDFRETSLRQRERDKATTIATLIEPRIHREEEWVRAASRSIQNALSAADRMEVHDPSVMARLDEAFEQFGLAELEATDSKGIVIHRAHAPQRKGDRSTRWGIDEALSGTSTLTSAPILEGALILHTVPLRANNRIVGTVTAGLRIDTPMIESLSKEFGADLELISRLGVPVASSRKTPTPPNLSAITEAFQQKIPVYRASADQQTTQVYFPLQIVDDGWILMAEIDSSSAQKLIDRRNRTSMLITLATMGLAIITMMLLIHRALKPLRVLRARAETLFTTLTQHPIPKRKEDDISSLVRILNDLTALLIRRNEELSQQRADLRISAKAFESQQPMLITTPHGEVLKTNLAFSKMSGYGEDEILGAKPDVLDPTLHAETFNDEIQSSLRDTGQWQGEMIGRRRNGDEYPQSISISSVQGEHGDVSHLILFYTDLSENRNSARKIQELALLDSLTRLPNRNLLLDRLKQAISMNRRNRSFGALIMVDFDNFKTLNDTQGYQKGDQLLLQASQRLLDTVRQHDTVARVGGDEFAVVLEDLGNTLEHAATHTEVVCAKILSKLGEPYHLNDSAYRCTTSIGGTIFGEQDISVETLLMQVDLALHNAKSDGRNTFRFFDPTMQEIVMVRAALERDIVLAQQNGQFLLHYQPQVTEIGQVVGAEALIRWRHPARGMVSPLDFIPLAEETGDIIPIGLWVLETACQQLNRWSSHPDRSHLSIAVNVSARQLQHPDFVDQVVSVLARTGANPAKLKLELTESLLAENVDALIVIMTTLQTHGVCFSLDDFGTGYSSLAYLKQLPLAQLKIDRSFIRDVMNDPDDAVIARTIVALARNLGLNVIAEGVETEAQQQFLASVGCTTYQGYLFGRPLAIEAFEALIDHGFPTRSPL